MPLMLAKDRRVGRGNITLMAGYRQLCIQKKLAGNQQHAAQALFTGARSVHKL
ncbi:hypothetical protein ACNVFB_000289 [Yersinia enterocolitica]